MCMQKHVLIKMFTNGLNIGLSLQTRVKKIVHGVETHCFTWNFFFIGKSVSKGGHADSALRCKRPITVNCFEKSTTVNSASNCQLLCQNSPYLLNDPHI